MASNRCRPSGPGARAYDASEAFTAEDRARWEISAQKDGEIGHSYWNSCIYIYIYILYVYIYIILYILYVYIYIYIHTVKPASWHQAQENMNGRCNLSQLNAHIPWTQNWGHTFGSWATNFSIVAPFLGPESGPCSGATKHKQELVNTGSKCATADASWQQHISVILYIYVTISIFFWLL